MKTGKYRMIFGRLTGIQKIIVFIILCLVVKFIYSWLVSDADFDNRQDVSLSDGTCVIQGDDCVPLLDSVDPRGQPGLHPFGKYFYLDGKPFRILSGSFHYFRTHPDQWTDRILKMKAAGLNTVMTYIPWNLHEPSPGQFDFQTWNLVSFVKMVHSLGMKMIIRPGPYICAEWDWGGLPSWLLRDRNMIIRNSSYVPFLKHVGSYFAKLLPLLTPLQWKLREGPIIAFQIENEFGSYGNDTEYLLFLRRVFEKFKLQELYFTSDGPNGLRMGEVPGVLQTVNFKKKPMKNLNALREFQPDKPLMVTEYWSGWFDHWTEFHHTDAVALTVERVATILYEGSSINFYMFVGGTNFGFYNGANNGSMYRPTITSYDYDAPISECGDTTPKYRALKELLLKLKLAPLGLPKVPPNSPKGDYGIAQIHHCMPYVSIMDLVSKNIVTMTDPVSMEMLDINHHGGQAFGWIMYRTTIPSSSTTKMLTIKGKVHDRAQFILNGREVGVMQWDDPGQLNIALSELEAEVNTLDIFVENTGRVNFKDYLNEQRKGIIGNVLLDGAVLTNWKHVPFEFDAVLIDSLRGASTWRSACQNGVPTAFRATLNIKDEPKDTFIFMKSWSKGIVIVNGMNLGRYWHVGPQQTLYIPSPILRKGRNDIIIFELHRGQEEVEFIDYPVLKDTTVSVS